MTAARNPDPFRAAEALARAHGLFELAADIRCARGSGPLVDLETEARVEQLFLDYRLARRWGETACGVGGAPSALRRSVDILECLLRHLRPDAPKGTAEEAPAT